MNQNSIQQIKIYKAGENMDILFSILMLAAMAITLTLAILAIIRGRKGMKASAEFDTESRKIKKGYWLTSAIHMWAGILITLCYAIAILSNLSSLLL